MIEIDLVIEDYDFGHTICLTLPGQIDDLLDKSHDYYVTSCIPNLECWYDNDVWKMNDLLQRINSENPGTTAQYLDALFRVSEVTDLFDEDFIQRVISNDFGFEDISELRQLYNEYDAQCLGAYTLVEQNVPFVGGITDSEFKFLQNTLLFDYIDWGEIWREYELMGFKIYEDYDNDSLYLIYWPPVEGT